MFPPSLSLRQRLLLLAVAVALPLLLCGSAALYLFAQQKRASLEASLVDTARALSAAVDSELLGVVTVAQAMSQSAAFDEKRFDRLYQLARRVRDDHPAWHTVTLTTAAGEPIFNLRRPFGHRLPRSAAEETMDELRSTGSPVIGNLFVGNVSGVPLFPVRVPASASRWCGAWWSCTVEPSRPRAAARAAARHSPYACRRWRASPRFRASSRRGRARRHARS